MENRFELVTSRSLFLTLHSSRLLNRTELSSKNIAYHLHTNQTEFKNIMSSLSNLQNLVIKKNNNNVKIIIKNLELNFAIGNNDKSILKSLYSSKIFMEIINAFNISLPEYHEQLLNLIELILQNKHITKYLSKNDKFLPYFMQYLTVKNMYSNSHKICENILMNSQGIFPMKKIILIINNIYNRMNKKNRLDNFSRILAILIFDYKKIELKQIFKDKGILRTKSLVKTSMENQFICLNLPGFITNLTNKLALRFSETKNVAVNVLTREIISYVYRQFEASNNFDDDLNDDNNNNNNSNLRINNLFSALRHNNNNSLNISNNRNILNNNNINTNEFNIDKYKNKLLTKNKLSQLEILTLIQLNIFQNFQPDFSKIKNEDNIYNSYMKITKILEKMKNQCQILPNRQNYVTMTKYQTYQIEMLFVLSSLLGCKRKTEIQDQLAEENLVSILNDYLESMKWGNIFSDNKRPFFTDQRNNVNDESAYHGEGCCCDQDTALKVQYLRLIYTFCCRDDVNLKNKSLLLSIFDIERFLDRCKYIDIIKIFLREKYKMYKNSIFATFNREFKNILNKLKFTENTIYEEYKAKNNKKDCEDLINNDDDNNSSNNNKYGYDLNFSPINININNKNNKYGNNDLNFCKNNINLNNNNSFNANKENSKINKDNEEIILNNEIIQDILNNMASLDFIEDIVFKYNSNFERFGLFHKLIFKYIQECYYSSAKFWLSSNIEVILRGNNTFLQLFAATSGLLPTLLYDILYSKPDQKQILQLSFDMLGEILKYNRGCFYLFDYYFNDSKEFNDFCNKIISKDNLVDSNVFLRAIILSNYFFTIDDINNHNNGNNFYNFVENCKICRFINLKIHSIFLNLITIVQPSKINQTNISCINTSLIILIIEYLKGELDVFLYEIRHIFKEEAKEAIENLTNLVVLWNKFYNYRPKDYESLQYSTTIQFNIWKKVTKLLLDKDKNNKMSLYYQDEDE